MIYLENCMYEKGELAKSERLTKDKVKNLLIKRVEEIQLDAAKEDVRPFLRDFTQLDGWSVDFFRYWIERLKCVE